MIQAELKIHLSPLPVKPHYRFRDISGRKFSRLTVLKCIGRQDALRRYWYLCKCDCGAKTAVDYSSITRGLTKSCGCLGRENASARMANKEIRKTFKYKRNGPSLNPIYATWCGMINRCLSTKNKCYKNYGGRGIKVCKRWMKFKNFLADMGLKPSPSHSIERINNNGNYTPKNCRWASRVQQANNKRNSQIIKFKGMSLTIAQWSDKLGIKYATILWRMHNWFSIKNILNPRDFRLPPPIS